MKKILIFLIVIIPLILFIKNNSGSLYQKNLYIDELFKKEQYSEAIKEAELLLNKTIQRTGNDSKLSVLTTQRLSYFYKVYGNPKKSLELYESILPFINKEKENNPVIYSIHLIYLANIYIDLGNLDKAETLLNESYNIRKANFKDNTEKIYEILSHLTYLYLNKNQFDKAKDLCDHAIEIAKNIYGNNKYEYVECIQYQANIYKNQNDFKRSESKYLEVISIIEKTYTRSSQKMIIPLLDIGNLYMKMEKYELSLNFLNEALKLSLVKLDALSLIFAQLHEAIGLCLSARGDYLKASVEFKKSLDIYKYNLDPDSSKIIKIEQYIENNNNILNNNK